MPVYLYLCKSRVSSSQLQQTTRYEIHSSTPELRGTSTNPITTKAARDHLSELVVLSRKVTIRSITTDRYERTVAEFFVNDSNDRQQILASEQASIYLCYVDQCPWT